MQCRLFPAYGHLFWHLKASKILLRRTGSSHLKVRWPRCAWWSCMPPSFSNYCTKKQRNKSGISLQSRRVHEFLSIKNDSARVHNVVIPKCGRPSNRSLLPPDLNIRPWHHQPTTHHPLFNPTFKMKRIVGIWMCLRARVFCSPLRSLYPHWEIFNCSHLMFSSWNGLLCATTFKLVLPVSNTALHHVVLASHHKFLLCQIWLRIPHAIVLSVLSIEKFGKWKLFWKTGRLFLFPHLDDVDVRCGCINGYLPWHFQVRDCVLRDDSGDGAGVFVSSHDGSARGGDRLLVVNVESGKNCKFYVWYSCAGFLFRLTDNSLMVGDFASFRQSTFHLFSLSSTCYQDACRMWC